MTTPTHPGSTQPGPTGTPIDEMLDPERPFVSEGDTTSGTDETTDATQMAAPHPDTSGRITIEGRKATFSYERKQGLPNYSSEMASVFLSDVVPDEVDVNLWVSANHRAYLGNAKAAVFDTLGISYTTDVLGNTLEDASVAAALTQPPPAPAPVAPVAPVPSTPQPPVAPAPVAPPVPAPNTQVPGTHALVGAYAPFPGVCGDCGGTDWWDNRAENDQKIPQNRTIGPDWKCKNQQCAHKVWRPGGWQYNKGAQKGGQQAPVQQVAGQYVPPQEPPF